jgi:hypothetical protein
MPSALSKDLKYHIKVSKRKAYFRPICQEIVCFIFSVKFDSARVLVVKRHAQVNRLWHG